MVRWRIEIRSRALLPSVSALVPAEQKGVYRSRKRTVVDARKEKKNLLFVDDHQSISFSFEYQILWKFYEFQSRRCAVSRV